MRTIAITRFVPSSINRCELTCLTRTPIDVAGARRQHAEYLRALISLGCEVIELPEEPEMADSVFVEDTAVVFDECAVIARPGAASRRAEVPAIRAALSPYRPLHEIIAPATLDGGDVLCIDRRVFVGLSTRTNDAAIEQLELLLQPLGYDVVSVPIAGCLHLKSAATVVSDDLVVVNPDLVDPRVFGRPWLEVPASAANLLRVNDTVLCPTVAATTAAQLESRSLRVLLLDNSELAKAEGGLTCCSLVFRA